jgi:hypothetical protein
MKRGGKALALIIGIVLVLAAPALVFFIRSPVLIVIDIPFSSLYGGTRRVLLRQVFASLALFRQVKPVMIAEGAGPDVLVFAVEEAASRSLSRRPYCVLFPYRYSEAALRYREQFPGIPAVLLEGRAGQRSGIAAGSGLFVFKTDQESDMYRAGLCAAILSGGTGKTVVFQDYSIEETGRRAFADGLREGGNGTAPLFLGGFYELSDFSGISCVVLAGSGAEYFEQNLTHPVIFYTWLDPGMVPPEVVLVFDDSPWALAVPAVKMIAKNQNEGRIPSDLLILSTKIADKDILRRLKKTVGNSR